MHTQTQAHAHTNTHSSHVERLEKHNALSWSGNKCQEWSVEHCLRRLRTDVVDL